MTDLGSLGRSGSTANAINDRGEVVGQSAAPPQYTTDVAVLWVNGRIEDLGTLPGAHSGSALAINDAGQIVGTSAVGTRNHFHAVLWQAGRITDLGALSERLDSLARDINDRGEILCVGEAPAGRRFFLLKPAEQKDPE